MKKTVSIIQTRLTHYRVPLFQRMRVQLAKEGIHLNLIHGHAQKSEKARNDEGHLEWAICVNNAAIKIGSLELLWQPALKHIKSSDLVIVPQENRLLLNYWLLLKKMASRQKIAFWGHGKNFQNESAGHPKERFRRFFLDKPDWWFAYTPLTEEILLTANYPASKITVLNNAIDTGALQNHARSISEDELCRLRKKLGIQGNHTGVFCGSIYPGKRMDVLMDAARRIRSQISDFELVVIGAGPDEHHVKAAAMATPWIHYAGPRFGYEKALFMKLGQVFLLPYIVGLAILDSFALGIPIIAMRDGNHSPEIAYLQHNANGIITSNETDDYANAVCKLFDDTEKRRKIVEQCLVDAKKYTIENMATNFTDGIIKCLN